MLLNKEFVSLTENLVNFLYSIKERLDIFDKKNKHRQTRIEFIKKNRENIFKELDRYFVSIWDIISRLKLSKDSYLIYQKYFYQKLKSLLNTEINKHIYKKPLGYSGDYITMNYIYDYSGDKNYLGNSSFEMLINNYTCNISVSRSNVMRKEFIKKEIEKIIKSNFRPKISSLGSGPGREIIELISENKINKHVTFKCIDYERKALNYIKKTLDKIPKDKKKFISIEYICKDITEIIRSEDLEKEIENSSLIYAIGLFDYLTDRLSRILIQHLCGFLKKKGSLIITNINLKNAYHRAYYEFLGDWKMIHRTKEDMISWLDGIDSRYSIRFKDVVGAENYLFLVIEKRK